MPRTAVSISYNSSSSAASSFSVDSRPSAKRAARSSTAQPRLAQYVSACVRWDGPYSALRPLRPALLSVVMSMPATWLAVGKNDVGLSGWQ